MDGRNVFDCRAESAGCFPTGRFGIAEGDQDSLSDEAVADEETDVESGRSLETMADGGIVVFVARSGCGWGMVILPRVNQHL